MCQTLIVTSYNLRLQQQYAHRFFDSYRGELDTMLVSEDIISSRATHTIPLTAHQNFLNMNSWRKTRDFKQDAVRFCHKPYAVWTALHEVYEPFEQGKYDSMLWIDADTVFKLPITQQWVNEHWRTDGVMTYLGRPNYHSETGMLWFNIQNVATREYIERVVELYNTNDIYALEETHDSYVWDWVRERDQKRRNSQRNTAFNDIGVDHKVPGGHILNYLFGNTIDHTKGSRRKAQGYSVEQQQV
jgi:hypothetical protein